MILCSLKHQLQFQSQLTCNSILSRSQPHSNNYCKPSLLSPLYQTLYFFSPHVFTIKSGDNSHFPAKPPLYKLRECDMSHSLTIPILNRGSLQDATLGLCRAVRDITHEHATFTQLHPHNISQHITRLRYEFPLNPSIHALLTLFPSISPASHLRNSTCSPHLTLPHRLTTEHVSLPKRQCPLHADLFRGHGNATNT